MKNINLTYDECIAILEGLDELIVTDCDGVIKYMSPISIEKVIHYEGDENARNYVGRHITEIYKGSRLPSFIASGEEERNEYLSEANSAKTIRFKKIKKDGKNALIIDYDLFKDELALRSFLDQIIGLENSGLINLNEKISDIRKRINMPVKNVTIKEIVGNSPPMLNLKNMIINISAYTSTVLITGETGTGKEVFAHAIHGMSPRATRPMVEVNSAAIPENLFESEMFGYTSGSFTGAKDGGKPGKFELADKGTLFLDEVDQIPYHLQPKLLRAIQEKNIDKIGAKSIPVDVRIIAATNKNLKQMVEEGRFREDLYYRLNIINFEIPPLRKRKEDIPLLALHFVDKLNLALNKRVTKIEPEVIELFYNYEWPGNIRELYNAIERAMVLGRNNVLTLQDFDFISESMLVINTLDARSSTLQQICDNAEEAAIKIALKRFYTKADAARHLGITRPTLYNKMNKYNIV